MPKPYSLDLRERVVSYVEAGHSRRAAAAHFRVSPSFVINLMTAFRQRGAVTPKALGGWRHSKLDPHRVFILRRVAEKDDISMPELAGELHAASGVKADPASLVANGRSLSGLENIAGSIPALRSTAFGSTPSSVSVGRIAAAFLTLIVAKRGFARVTRSKPASSRGADCDRSVRRPGGRIRIPRHLAQFADFWVAKSMTAISWGNKSPPLAVERGKARSRVHVRSPTCRLAALGGLRRREPLSNRGLNLHEGNSHHGAGSAFHCGRFPLKRTPSSAPKAFTGQAARVRAALSSPIGQWLRDATTALAFASADDAGASPEKRGVSARRVNARSSFRLAPTWGALGGYGVDI